MAGPLSDGGNEYLFLSQQIGRRMEDHFRPRTYTKLAAAIASEMEKLNLVVMYHGQEKPPQLPNDRMIYAAAKLHHELDDTKWGAEMFARILRMEERSDYIRKIADARIKARDIGLQQRPHPPPPAIAPLQMSDYADIARTAHEKISKKKPTGWGELATTAEKQMHAANGNGDGNGNGEKNSQSVMLQAALETNKRNAGQIRPIAQHHAEITDIYLGAKLLAKCGLPFNATDKTDRIVGQAAKIGHSIKAILIGVAMVDLGLVEGHSAKPFLHEALDNAAMKLAFDLGPKRKSQGYADDILSVFGEVMKENFDYVPADDEGRPWTAVVHDVIYNDFAPR